MKKGNVLVSVIIILLVVGLCSYGVYNGIKKRQAPPAHQMPAPAVSVAKPVLQDVTEYCEFTGSTEAVESVAVRARVEGYLTKIYFKEGSEIKKGDLLFEIESDSYRARRDRAVANLQAAEAELLSAEQDLERVEKAVKSNAVSKQELTTRIANRDKAKASVLGYKADLADAELALSYTKIYSPIDGRISKTMVDAGNLVGAGERTLLATVVRMDPLYVSFNVSEKILQNKLKDKVLVKSDSECLGFCMSFSGDYDFSQEGKINYIDNEINPNTGTIYVRGTVENSQREFLPGMFVRVKVPVELKKDAVLVKERALCSDLDSKYLLIVGEGNIVSRRPVKLGMAVGKLRVIEQGLSSDEKYIVKGLQFARPGLPVQPQLIPNEESKVAAAKEAKHDEKVM